MIAFEKISFVIFSAIIFVFLMPFLDRHLTVVVTVVFVFVSSLETSAKSCPNAKVGLELKQFTVCS